MTERVANFGSILRRFIASVSSLVHVRIAGALPSISVFAVPTLEIKDLYASVETKEGRKQILRGVNLTVNSGETHAIMGPNGSGKSTLAYTLAGHPKYEVDSGQVLLDGEDILLMTPDERAKAGLFLAMQYPVEVPGVSMTNFLPRRTGL